MSEITKTEKTTENTATGKMGSRKLGNRKFRQQKNDSVGKRAILCCPFSCHLYFRCRIFSLPNFLLPIFPLPFFCCPFSVAVISHINFVLPCFPTLSFFVADFSSCPIFRLPFLPLPFFSVALFTVAVFAVNRDAMYLASSSYDFRSAFLCPTASTRPSLCLSRVVFLS